MNSKIYCLVALLVAGSWLGQTRAAAQDVAPSAAEISHTVDFPKGDAAWSVALESRTTKGAAPGRSAKKIDALRRNDIRRDLVTWSDGTSTDCWWFEKYSFALFQSETNSPVIAVKSGYLQSRRYDASTFSWVGKSNFLGMQSFNGKKCRHYRAEMDAIQGEKRYMDAWIDDITSRPVAYMAEGTRAVFLFDLPIPDTPLVLPSAYQKEYDRLVPLMAHRKLVGG